MKKILTILTLVAGMAIVSFSSNAQNTDNKIKAAFNSSCGGVGNVIVSSPTIISACFVDGFITRYFIIEVQNCNQVDCTIARPRVYGYVETGCDGEVINVVCY